MPASSSTQRSPDHDDRPPLHTRRTSDLDEPTPRHTAPASNQSFTVSRSTPPVGVSFRCGIGARMSLKYFGPKWFAGKTFTTSVPYSKRSEEHTSELHSPCNLVCRLLPLHSAPPTTTTAPHSTPDALPISTSRRPGTPRRRRTSPSPCPDRPRRWA